VLQKLLFLDMIRESRNQAHPWQEQYCGAQDTHYCYESVFGFDRRWAHLITHDIYRHQIPGIIIPIIISLLKIRLKIGLIAYNNEIVK
jgi:hypothetical protein